MGKQKATLTLNNLNATIANNTVTSNNKQALQDSVLVTGEKIVYDEYIENYIVVVNEKTKHKRLPARKLNSKMFKKFVEREQVKNKLKGEQVAKTNTQKEFWATAQEDEITDEGKTIKKYLNPYTKELVTYENRNRRYKKGQDLVESYYKFNDMYKSIQSKILTVEEEAELSEEEYYYYKNTKRGTGNTGTLTLAEVVQKNTDKTDRMTWEYLKGALKAIKNR